MEHKVQVNKKQILVDASFLAEYEGKNKNTIRGWKNSKGMPIYDVEDGANIYDLIPTLAWIKANISQKFNKNKDKTGSVDSEKQEFELNLPDGLSLSEIDTKNSEHLKILAVHPLGEVIRDTLEFRVKYEKQEFELRVKKREFLKTEELNARMSEFIALVKDVDINSRQKFPMELAEDLINENIITVDDKDKVQQLIFNRIDEINKKKYDIIYSQFMKHIEGNVTVDFLEELIDKIKEENENE